MSKCHVFFPRLDFFFFFPGVNKLYRLFTRSLFFRTSFLYLVNFGLFIMVYDLWEWMISSEIDKFFIVFSENYLFVMYFFFID